MSAFVILALGLALFLAVSVFLWMNAKFEWLDKLCTGLVFSLPFERIPSLSLGGVSVRISQLLVIAGIWVFAVLFVKKDKLLAEIKLNKINVMLVIFAIVSIPSMFFVIDSRRFLVTMIATYLCFGAVFLLSNFAQNIEYKLKLLFYNFIFVSLFGIYQFVGDLAGLPIVLTGLRENYTSKVFGIPRIQGTAIEPLYFAGMLFFPLIYTILHLVSGVKIETPKFLKIKDIRPFSLVLLSGVFVLTLSKGAYVVMAFTLVLAFLLTYSKLQSLPALIKFISSKYVIYSTLTAFAVILIFARVRDLIVGILNNFIATVTFQFASSVERLYFIQAALALLPKNIISGIGSGQYGSWLKVFDLVQLPGADEGYLIVNNVYLEVWLEFGILAFIVFLFTLWLPVFENSKILYNEPDWKTPKNLARLTLCFSLVGYYLQWLTFSPIFIMPIFIFLGLLANLAENSK